jgi:uncharacterized protein GlcG (DUF336 family)
MYWCFKNRTMNITLIEAEKVITNAIQKATEIDTKMNIAVVDSAAHLVAFSRMVNVLLGAIDIALKKAKKGKFISEKHKCIG